MQPTAKYLLTPTSYHKKDTEMEENYEQRLKTLEDRLTNIEQKLNAIYMQQNAQAANPAQFRQPVQQGAPMQQGMPIQPGNPVQQNAPYVQPQQSAQAANPAQFRQPVQQGMPVQQGIPVPPRPARKNGRDMESFIGRDVFVIIAAVLVFIGFIYFAGAIFPYLSKTAWFAIMCVASISLTAVSYVFVRKKESNLSIALLGSGLGTIYITLFLGKFYFRMVNTFILFAALILLMLAIYHCSKYKTLMFNIIGQLGILVSLLVCLGYAFAAYDWNFAMYAIIYVAVSEIFYDQLFGEKKYLLNILSMLFAISVLSFPVLMTIESDSISDYHFYNKSLADIFTAFDMQLVGFLLMVLMFVYIIIRNALLMKKEKISIDSYAIVSIAGFLVFIQAMTHLEFTLIVKLVMMLYTLVIMAETELFIYDKKRTASCHALWNILIIGFLWLYFIDADTLYVPAIIFTVPLAIYMFRTKTTLGKQTLYAGLASATVFDILTKERFWDYNGTVHLSAISFYVICVLLTLILFGFLFQYRDKVSENVKILSYIVTFGHLYVLTYLMTELVDWDHKSLWGACIVAVLLGIACLIQYSYRFVFKYSDCDKPLSQSAFSTQTVINEVILFWAVFAKLHDIADISPYVFVLTVVFVILLTIFNSDLMLRQENSKLGLFVGIQSTLVACVIMSSFNDWRVKGFIISISMFVCAVVCIIVGLKFSQKNLRVYALILAMISTIKITLYDSSHESMLGTAVSFFICAILCFTISWIYSRIEKWVKTAD